MPATATEPEVKETEPTVASDTEKPAVEGGGDAPKEDDAAVLDSVAPVKAKAEKADAAPEAAPDLSGPQWAELRRVADQYGIAPQQMLAYASKGYQAEQAAAANKATPPVKPAAATGDDEDFVPVSQKELHETIRQLKQGMQVNLAGVQNETKLDALLNNKALTRDEPVARDFVKRETYRLMAGGADLDRAFAQASKDHGAYLARVGKRTIAKKVAAQAAAGETGGGEASPLEVPEYKHAATDFTDGTALQQAKDIAKRIHGRNVAVV